MGKRLDIKAGDRFGKLTVVRELEHKCSPSGCTHRQFLCKCQCGNTVVKNTLQLSRTPYCIYCKIENPYVADMENEEWRDIDGYEGLYKVSNKGRVKSLIKETRIGNRIKVHPEKILQPAIGKRGYWVVGLSKGGKATTKTLHRLIAVAFIPNPENKPCIDHIDTDRTNCSIENLRWVTAKENSNNPKTIDKNRNKMVGLWRMGKFEGRDNITYIHVGQYDLNGVLIKEWDSIIDAAKTIHVDGSSISAVCLGKRKTAGGFIWKHIGKRYKPTNND